MNRLKHKLVARDERDGGWHKARVRWDRLGRLRAEQDRLEAQLREIARLAEREE